MYVRSVCTDLCGRRHLFQDLQPYLCLDVSCGLSDCPFPTKAQWEAHLALDHGQTDDCHGIICPICQEETLSGRVNVMSHLAKHMEEIALTSLPTNADSEDGTDVDSGLASEASSSLSVDVSVLPLTRVISRGNRQTLEPGQSGEPAGPNTHPDTLQCSHCSRRFTRALDLRKHLRMHELPRSCAVCGKGYATQRDLKRHEYSHAVREPEPSYFVCEGSLKAGGGRWGCGRRFTRRNNLARHLKTEAGRSCIKPLLDEEAMEQGSQQGEQLGAQQQAVGQQLVGVSHDSSDFDILPHLAPRYSAHENMDWAASSNQGDGDAIDLDPGDLLVEESEILSKALSEEGHKPYPQPEIAAHLRTNFEEERAIHGASDMASASQEQAKHENMHHRPWKCPIPTCKYHEYGWGTQKEMARHVNDKHSATPALYKCLYAPCPYESKRESNCKQHMEKAHGWNYVRTKNNGQKKVTYSSEQWSALKGLQEEEEGEDEGECLEQLGPFNIHYMLTFSLGTT